MQEITVASPVGNYLDAGYAILGIGVVLLSFGAIVLYLRSRSIPALVMLIAGGLGWLGVILVAFGPEEAQQLLSYTITDSSSELAGGTYSFTRVSALMLPGMIAVIAGILGWGLGFVCHALSVSRCTCKTQPRRD